MDANSDTDQPTVEPETPLKAKDTPGQCKGGPSNQGVKRACDSPEKLKAALNAQARVQATCDSKRLKIAEESKGDKAAVDDEEIEEEVEWDAMKVTAQISNLMQRGRMVHVDAPFTSFSIRQELTTAGDVVGAG